MVIDLTKLTRDNIVAMLEYQGYNESSSDITDTEYVSCKNGQVKYRISYYDIDDNLIDTEHVYVFINNEGELAADY